MSGRSPFQRKPITHNGNAIQKTNGAIIQTPPNDTVRENATDVVGVAPTSVGGI
jgi:hypothetical protein